MPNLRRKFIGRNSIRQIEKPAADIEAGQVAIIRRPISKITSASVIPIVDPVALPILRHVAGVLNFAGIVIQMRGAAPAAPS